VNGGGKSSLAGAAFRGAGGEYYNPDEAARRIRDTHPALSQHEANALAWQQGVRLLERAIDRGLAYAFETTLGASTIPRILARAATAGAEVRVWYVGLDTVERHIARVRVRVLRGGHDIPEADIRRRFETSRLNLVELMPSLAALRVYDNSAEADPAKGALPNPRLILHVERGRIIGPHDLAATPRWAKAIVARAME